jgi:hypothetical protein
MTEVNEMMRERTATGGRWIDQASVYVRSVARANDPHARSPRSFDVSWSKQA